MDRNFLIPINPVLKGKRGGERPFRKLPLIDRVNTPLGYILLLLVSCAIGVGITFFGFKFGVIVLIAIIAPPLVYTIVAYPKIGLTIFLTMSYLIMWFLKMGVEFPLGTLMDGMEGLFILSLLIQQKKKPDWKIFKGPISVMILVWMTYNFIEVANPSAESRIAWVYTVRSVAIVMIMFFIFLYNIRTKQFIRFVLKLWLGLALFGALYAFKQQHIGFFPFEERYLHSNPDVELLLFIGGTWRKFSIFSDPVSFSYTMAVSSMLCVGLMTGPFSKKKKIILFLLMCFYIMNMLYSGTRGAYVLVPAGMLMYAILKYSKKILLFTCIGAAAFLVIVFIPTSNYTLYRFQSAFKPSDDPSFNLRKINQKRIQPYIQSHPLGGGLGSTGEWGNRFNPGSYLALFQPDSGYVRVVVEMGWIGLFLICLLIFTILKTGINNYYSIRDPELKSYCLAMVLVVFAFHVGNYPQEALVQYPSNVYFYLVTALIVILKRIDDQQNKLLDAAGGNN